MLFTARINRSTFTVLAAAGLAGSIVVGGALNAQAATGVQRPDWAALFVAQINTDRIMYHQPALTVTSALTVSSQRWAASMARSDTLAHNPNLATSVTGWRYLGENVGVGYGIGDLKHAFWQSAGHRANMLDKDFTQLGVAVVFIDGKVWVAEEFARPLPGATVRARISERVSTAATTPAGWISTLGVSQARAAAGTTTRTRPGHVLGTSLPRPVTQILT